MTKSSGALIIVILLLCGMLLSACHSTATPSDAQLTPTVMLPTQEATLSPNATSTSEATLPMVIDTTPSAPPSATTVPPSTATDTPQPAPTLPSPTDTPTDNPLRTQSAPAQSTPIGQAIIIDHNSVALFEQIPDEYLEKARNLRVVFVDQSVGHNISQGLDCLTAPTWADSPSYCRRDYEGANWNWKTFGSSEINLAPERIRFEPDPIRYDRSQWTFVERRGPWYSSIENFATSDVPEYRDSYDVLSIKITYLMVADNSGINDPENGFFAADSNRFGWKDLKALQEQNLDKIFFFWTSSLSRSIGSQAAVEFNERMRQEAIEQGLTLFDIADIESHTDQGKPCYDNRDGIQYCTQAGKCENYPDDGLDLPAICQDYTTETDGGHLGSVSGGTIRLSKAFWVLIAQIAGWRP